MPRLSDVLAGLGRGASEELRGQRKRQQEQQDKIGLLEAEARLKQQYDPDAIVKNRLINLARLSASRVAPPGGFSQLERENPQLESAMAPAREQTELDILRHILPRTSSAGVNVYSFDPSTGQVVPATGGTNLPVGSRVIPTRITPQEAASIAGGREQGKVLGRREVLPELGEEKQHLAASGARGVQQVKYEDLVKQFNFISKDVDSVFSFLEKIPAGRIAGPSAQIGSFLGMEGSENVLQYTRTKDLILSKIARTFGGEVGVLTEGDIKRISKGFPTLWMNDREREASVRWVKDYIQRRVEEYREIPSAVRRETNRTDGRRMRDAQGNEALVYPDGTIEELP